jgi:hypothetical protein
MKTLKKLMYGGALTLLALVMAAWIMSLIRVESITVEESSHEISSIVYERYNVPYVPVRYLVTTELGESLVVDRSVADFVVDDKIITPYVVEITSLDTYLLIGSKEVTRFVIYIPKPEYIHSVLIR